MSDAGAIAHEEAIAADSRHVLAITQLFFFLALLVCVALDHTRTVETDGISFYGVHAETIPIIVAGFAVASVGLWRTSTHFARARAPRLTVVGLRIFAVGLFVLLATPFNRGPFLNWTHMIVGVGMALIQLAISMLLLRRRREIRSVLGFVLQLAGGILAAVSLPDWHFVYLLQGETIYELGFSWMLIEWTYALSAQSRAAA